MAAAAKLLGTFRGGRPCHPSTVVRWCLDGIKLANGQRLKLEFIRMTVPTAGHHLPRRPGRRRLFSVDSRSDGHWQIGNRCLGPTAFWCRDESAQSSNWLVGDG
jgi:hypothetical protein